MERGDKKERWMKERKREKIEKTYERQKVGNNTSEKVKETRSKPCSISSGRVPDAAAAAKPCSETRTGRTAWIYRLFRPTQKKSGAESGPQKSVAHVPEQCINQLCVSISPRPTGSDSCWIFPCFR
ncbi:hypothetical protein KUCAC02_033269, partial [Chaenocephalus aceratus]